MNNGLISIIIPCYRQAHLLPKAIKSCLRQTYANIEIIIVDDGSPDNVVEEVEQFHFDSRIRLIRQENNGLSAARNAGLFEALGAYVKFLDSDDWLLPHCLEQQYQSIRNIDHHISVIGHSLYFEGNERIKEDVYPSFGKLSHALCYVNIGPPHTFLYPTEIMKKLGGFSTEDRVKGGHEDYDLLCRLVVQDYEAVVLHTIGCIYRQTANSMSTNMGGMRRSRSKVWQHYASQLLQKFSDPAHLIHLLGGYTTRLASVDFRYEALRILKKIRERLVLPNNKISQADLILLCSSLSDLIKYLPCPVSTEEANLKEESVQIIFDLAEIVLAQINTEPVLKRNKSLELLNFGVVMIQTGMKKEGRKVVQRAITMPPDEKYKKTAISILYFLSGMLPGSIAVYLWRNICLAYSIFFKHLYIRRRTDKDYLF